MPGALPEKEMIIRPCNHTQLAAAYGISPKVLRTWLRPYQKEIGPRSGYKYSLEQLFIIFDKIGWPLSGPGGEQITYSPQNLR